MTDREIVVGGFRLDLLIEAVRLAIYTYYYQLRQLVQLDTDDES